jgi:phosphoribosylaminoimidazole-succinocarboxamide synthase
MENPWNDIQSSRPIKEGYSKTIYWVDQNTCLIKLKPNLRSFTFDRSENIAGIEAARLDFYEEAAHRLRQVGIPTAFKERVSETMYLADFCVEPPFEVIVKNVATGSTSRKYPGLFEEGTRFRKPIVKFDYRIEPEDQPIADDYVQEWGIDPKTLKEQALAVNRALQDWLAPRDLWDFCLVFGYGQDERLMITSEISPDCMRLKSSDGFPLDKDLFREGRGASFILKVWKDLARELKE